MYEHALGMGSCRGTAREGLSCQPFPPGVSPPCQLWPFGRGPAAPYVIFNFELVCTACLLYSIHGNSSNLLANLVSGQTQPVGHRTLEGITKAFKGFKHQVGVNVMVEDEVWPRRDD